MGHETDLVILVLNEWKRILILQLELSQDVNISSLDLSERINTFSHIMNPGETLGVNVPLWHSSIISTEFSSIRNLYLCMTTNLSKAPIASVLTSISTPNNGRFSPSLYLSTAALFQVQYTGVAQIISKHWLSFFGKSCC